MPTLNLGVFDLPHLNGRTTGQVAEHLEDRYGVMQAFFDLRRDEIEKAIVDSYSQSIGHIISGDAPELNPFAQAGADIEHMFKDTVLQRGFDGVISGVPTQASLTGKSKGSKWGQGKGRRTAIRSSSGRVTRPSFVDTWLYVNSFTAWVD